MHFHLWSARKSWLTYRVNVSLRVSRHVTNFYCKTFVMPGSCEVLPVLHKTVTSMYICTWSIKAESWQRTHKIKFAS